MWRLYPPLKGTDDPRLEWRGETTDGKIMDHLLGRLVDVRLRSAEQAACTSRCPVTCPPENALDTTLPFNPWYGTLTEQRFEALLLDDTAKPAGCAEELRNKEDSTYRCRNEMASTRESLSDLLELRLRMKGDVPEREEGSEFSKREVTLMSLKRQEVKVQRSTAETETGPAEKGGNHNLEAESHDLDPDARAEVMSGSGTPVNGDIGSVSAKQTSPSAKTSSELPDHRENPFPVTSKTADPATSSEFSLNELIESLLSLEPLTHEPVEVQPGKNAKNVLDEGPGKPVEEVTASRVPVVPEWGSLPQEIKGERSPSAAAGSSGPRPPEKNQVSAFMAGSKRQPKVPEKSKTELLVENDELKHTQSAAEIPERRENPGTPENGNDVDHKADLVVPAVNKVVVGEIPAEIPATGTGSVDRLTAAERGWDEQPHGKFGGENESETETKPEIEKLERRDTVKPVPRPRTSSSSSESGEIALGNSQPNTAKNETETHLENEGKDVEDRIQEAMDIDVKDPAHLATAVDTVPAAEKRAEEAVLNTVSPVPIPYASDSADISAAGISAHRDIGENPASRSEDVAAKAAESPDSAQTPDVSRPQSLTEAKSESETESETETKFPKSSTGHRDSSQKDRRSKTLAKAVRVYHDLSTIIDYTEDADWAITTIRLKSPRKRH